MITCAFGRSLSSLGSAPQEDVTAPHGLQVAVDEGDHLILPRQHQRITCALAAQLQLNLRVGPDSIGIYPVMHHCDLGAEGFGERARLPGGRCNRRIRDIEMHIVIEVFEPEAAVVTRHILNRKLGIKASIGPFGQIEELTKDTQLRLGPDLFQKQAFAPPRMRDNGIRLKALILERKAGPKRPLGADDLGLKIHHPRVGAGVEPWLTA